MMAQQHYDGKKHKKNAARADLLEQLGKTLDLGELRGEGKGRAGGCCCIVLVAGRCWSLAHLKLCVFMEMC